MQLGILSSGAGSLNLFWSGNTVEGKIDYFAALFRSQVFAEPFFFKRGRHLKKTSKTLGACYLFWYQRFHDKLDVNKNLGGSKYFDYHSSFAAHHFNYAIIFNGRIQICSLSYYEIKLTVIATSPTFIPGYKGQMPQYFSMVPAPSQVL